MITGTHQECWNVSANGQLESSPLTAEISELQITADLNSWTPLRFWAQSATPKQQPLSHTDQGHLNSEHSLLPSFSVTSNILNHNSDCYLSFLNRQHVIDYQQSDYFKAPYWVKRVRRELNIHQQNYKRRGKE